MQKLQNEEQDLCLQLIEVKRRRKTQTSFKRSQIVDGSYYRGGYNFVAAGEVNIEITIDAATMSVSCVSTADWQDISRETV